MLDENTYTITLTVLVIIASICCSMAIAVIVIKKPRTVLDEVLAHAFLTQILCQIFFLAQSYTMQHARYTKSVKSYEIYAILSVFHDIFSLDSMAFLTMTAIQQYIAVFYPLKLRIWVTTHKTRVTLAIIYVTFICIFVSFYLVSRYGNLDQQLLVSIYGITKGLVFYGTFVAVLFFIYSALVFKFMKRVCCKRSLESSESSSMHGGQFQDRKTLILLYSIFMGAIINRVGMSLVGLKGVPEDIIRLGVLVLIAQWIWTPCIYIAINLKAWKGRQRRASQAGYSTNSIRSTSTNL